MYKPGEHTELLLMIDQYMRDDREMRSNSVPSKRSVKRQGGGFKNPNSVFKTCGPGSSRSSELDALKAISAEETGCVVVSSSRGMTVPKSTTSRDSGNVIGGYHIVQ